MILRPFALLLLVSPWTLAKPAAWEKNLSPESMGKHAPLTSGRLEYDVSWKGILDSGKLIMDFFPKDQQKPNTLIVRSSASSKGIAAVAFPYHGYMWSELDSKTIRPRFFNAKEITHDERVTTSARYFGSRVDSLETTLKNGISIEEKNTFSHTPIYDISSAILYIRSQKLNDGDEIQIVIHPFNSPYLLQAKVLSHERHLGRDAIRLSVNMRKIDRETLELKNYKKLKKAATMWLSDDQNRVPIEFRAQVFIGDIRATLKEYRKS